MTYIVDRRLNGKNKSSVNRQRFLQRYRAHIQKAVSDAVTGRKLTDLDTGEKITIPKKEISEPMFQHGTAGNRRIVHPGNKEFVTGDQIARPNGGGGGGGGSGDAGQDGEGEDEFSFSISRDEFLEFLFEDLALPNLIKRHLAGVDSFKLRRAGVVSDGSPTKLNIVRSMRSSLARRIAIGAPLRAQLQELLDARESLLRSPEPALFERRIGELDEEIAQLQSRLQKIPFLDSYDLRYNFHAKQPQPSAKAVMFCLMDVSGSMNQNMKEIAKRFFLLLYLFLQRNYERTEVVFIRHHTSAKEVDEQEFFYSRETGGTIVSSALTLMHEIIQARYPAGEWNIYGAQASDGDNWADDSPVCQALLTEKLLPLCQYYTYVEIMPRRHQSLWEHYEQVRQSHPDHFAMQDINDLPDIYPVFRQLFQRRLA